tara:strand:+ start:128 stop:469 length:342 start_codon:yes stop_codon:yes gene_type:complete
MKTKNTPGSWAADPCAHADGSTTIRLADGSGCGNTECQPIAQVWHSQDARLIAAAPELLEALEHLKRHVAECNAAWEADGAPIGTKEHGLAVCLNNRSGDLINAAIAKVKGGK